MMMADGGDEAAAAAEMEMLEASQYLSGERDLLDEDRVDLDSDEDDVEAEGAAAAAAAAAAAMPPPPASDSEGGKDDVEADGAAAAASVSMPPLEQGQHGQHGQQHSTSHYYTFLADKAGMQGVSKEEVARIVHEASVNSRYYKHQQRQDEKMQIRIQQIQAKCRTLTDGQRRLLEERADRELAEAERAHRSYGRVCCVCDLDAFFAAVEERDRPELKEKPFAVGGGVVCTASYVARRFGVRSAMPTFIAKRLCPDLLILPTRFEAYTEVAEHTRAIFREYDPNFRTGSLDEAYLDLTAAVQARAAAAGVAVPPSSAAEEREREDEDEEEDAEADHEGGSGGHGRGYDNYWELAEGVVAEIRARIQEACRITASAGIACSFMLAKIASNERKPNGQFLVRDVAAYLHGLPVRSVGGIGRKTERVLMAGLGIETVKDLFAKRALLYHAFTPLTAHWLATRYLGVDLAGGEDEAAGAGGGGGHGRRGISKERTFEVISRQDEIWRRLRDICEALAADMREEGLQARCVTLKLKTKEFDVTTRAKTLAHYIATADELFEAAHAVLLPQLPVSLRLMGVRASAFRPKPAKDQGTLDAFLAKTAAEGKGSMDPFAALRGPAAPSPAKRKEGGGGSGTIQAFLAKRSTGASSSGGGNPTNNAAAAAAAAAEGSDGVIVIDDFSPPPSQQQPHSSGGPTAAAAASYTCPICGSVRPGESLAAFNSHVDGCLARTDPHFESRRKRATQQEQQQLLLQEGGGGKGKKMKKGAGPLDAFLKR